MKFRTHKITVCLILPGVLLFFSCAREKDGRIETAPTQLQLIWVALEEGGFYAVDHPVPGKERKPWTTQERISDFEMLHGRVYAAVNGYGLAEIEWEAGAGPHFSYHYIPDILQNRTITELLAAGDDLLCHCYFNTQLNVISSAEWKRDPVNLLRYSFAGSGSEIEIVVPPYQKTHPGWELKTLFRKAPDQIFFEWKLSDTWRTDFSYSRWDLDSLREVGITRESFRRNYWSADIASDVKSTARRLADALGDFRTYFFHVRSEGSAVRDRFRIVNPGLDAVAIPMHKVSSADGPAEIYALGPSGRIFRSRGGKDPLRTAALPPLPQGFTYTDFIVSGGRVILAWEESDFTDVGAAGLLLYPDLQFQGAALP